MGATRGVTSAAAHRGIWHGAGATKSWSSVVSVRCSCRISLFIPSNDNPGGWATRTIHFSLLAFSTVSITLIQQETISLAIRNHSFRHPMEGRLTFKDITPVVIRTKRLNFLRSTVYKIHWSAKSNPLDVPERSQNHLPKNNKCRAHILDRNKNSILWLLSFRIRYVVASNKFSSPIPCLTANEQRTDSDGS